MEKVLRLEIKKIKFCRNNFGSSTEFIYCSSGSCRLEFTITAEKVKRVENIVDEIEKIFPPIKSFFISGATEDGAVFDIRRTLARRAERRVVAAKEEGKMKVNDETLSYLNRLSSLLYALARIASQIEGAEEIKPDYK